MITFDWPWMFILIPLPLILRLVIPKASPVDGVPVYAPFVLRLQFGDEFVRQGRSRKGIIGGALLVWLLLLFAGARPQWLGEPLQLPKSGRSLMLSIDISGSMEIPDLDMTGGQTSRLGVIKQVAGDFIQRRSGDRIGLILFGSNAYLQAPLTFDRITVGRFLDESEIGLAGKQTAIGDAIGLAVKRLRKVPKGKAALILMTDGANTSGVVTPRQAADLAAQAGLKIYTIGVGADEMWVQGIFGNRKVNPSQDLDEETLKYIADKTGGVYFRAKDKNGLEKIYDRLDELEPIESDNRVVRPVTELFFWPLGAGFILSIFWSILLVIKVSGGGKS